MSVVIVVRSSVNALSLPRLAVFRSMCVSSVLPFAMPLASGHAVNQTLFRAPVATVTCAPPSPLSVTSVSPVTVRFGVSPSLMTSLSRERPGWPSTSLGCHWPLASSSSISAMRARLGSAPRSAFTTAAAALTPRLPATLAKRASERVEEILTVAPALTLGLTHGALAVIRTWPLGQRLAVGLAAAAPEHSTPVSPRTMRTTETRRSMRTTLPPCARARIRGPPKARRGSVTPTSRVSGEQASEPGEPVVQLGVGDRQRREQAQRGRAGRVEDQALLGQRATDQRGGRLGARRVQLGGEHEAAAADLDDAGQLAELVPQRAPDLTHAREQLAVADDVQDRQPGRALHRAAGERRAMVAGLEALGEALVGDDGADRQPPAKRLGHGHEVGHDAGVLVGPQRPGPPQPDLDLVEDQRRAHAVAGRARRAQDLGRQLVDAALTLDRLQDHGRAVVVDRRLQRLDRRRDREEPRHQRRERRLLGLLRRRAQRPVRAAVKAAVHRDDRAALLGLARHLDRGL